MPDAFVPFFDHMGAKAASAAAATPANAFVPMPTSAPQQSAPAAPAPSVHQPVIKLERDGDRIRQIRIQCSCGQIIELECTY